MLDVAGMGIAVLFGIFMFVIFLWSLIWSYGDAESRGKSGCLVVLLVLLLSWPVGLLVWFVFRPDKKDMY